MSRLVSRILKPRKSLFGIVSAAISWTVWPWRLFYLRDAKTKGQRWAAAAAQVAIFFDSSRRLNTPRKCLPSTLRVLHISSFFSFPLFVFGGVKRKLTVVRQKDIKRRSIFVKQKYKVLLFFYEKFSIELCVFILKWVLDTAGGTEKNRRRFLFCFFSE